MPKNVFLTLFASAAFSVSLHASVPVVVEAEGGTAGSEMVQGSDGSSNYLTASTDETGDFPSTSARTARFQVTFPAAGTYQLYVRLYVGPLSGNDDSFFYGNGFGQKDPTNADDWILVNQLGSGIGSTRPEDFVPGEDAAGSEVWKWVMLSGFDGGINFTVPAGQLTQTFDIGAREDGLRIDKFAFGADGFFYTVDNLDKGEAGTESTPSEPFTPTGPPIASGKWKWLGSVHSSSQLPNFTAYWNQVTPENAGKWGSVEGTRDVMNWSGLDAAYNFAKENGYKFRMHILIWGAQQPGWINDLSPTEQLEEIKEWFAAVAERYPDIDYLEVANEPLHQAPDGGNTGVVPGQANYIAALGGKGETGWDWLLESFRLAREYFPGTPLVMNDYGIIGSSVETARYLELVDLLMEEDLLDIIAFQAHAFSSRASAAALKQNLDTLASRGLPIMVTEMDIDGVTDIAQLADYKKIFPVFWEHPSVIGITLWGYRPGMWRSDQGAYLVLNNGAERPAMTWLQDFVAASTFDNFDGYLERQGLDPDLHGFGMDFDEDSLTTGWEYLTGTDPESRNTVTLSFERQLSLDTLEFPISSEIRDGAVLIQSSENLRDWTTEARFDLLTRKRTDLEASADGETFKVVFQQAIDGEAPAKFYRVAYSR